MDGQDGEIQAEPTIAAIDPGVVNFATWYTPTLGSGIVANRDIERIFRLCIDLDKLIGKTTRAPALTVHPHVLYSIRGCTVRPARKGNSHRRAQARVLQRIKNLVDEVHKKTVIWLVRTFDIIVLPEFSAQRMSIRRPGRRLGKKTVRKMLTWAHARFRQRLLNKAEEVGVTVITSVSEAYTSKTCSGCGHIHRRLGGSRVFRCAGCGIVMDRDVKEAKGILLRALASRLRCKSMMALVDGPRALGTARAHVDR